MPSAAGVKLLYFYKAGCSWCDEFEAVLQDDVVAEIIKKNTDIVKIDVQGSGQIKDISSGICKTAPSEGQLGPDKRRTAPHNCSIITNSLHEGELVARFAVQQTPTLIFLSSAGEELLRIPGFLPKEDFLELLCTNVRGIEGCNEFFGLGILHQEELN